MCASPEPRGTIFGMKHTEEKERYIVARATSLKHALRGIRVFVEITPNFWIHFFTYFVVILLGVFFHLSNSEWVMLVIANGLVIAAEAVNSAIEIDMDITHPKENPMVRDTKDIAAGAVLIAGVSAWIVDLLVFLNHIHW